MKNIKISAILFIIIFWGGFVCFKYWVNHPNFIQEFKIFLDIIKPLGYLFLFLLLSYCAGFLVFIPFNKLQLTLSEKSLFRFGLGFSLLILLVFFFGICGILYKNVFLFIFAGIFILFLLFFIKDLNFKKQATIKAIKKENQTPPIILFLFLGFIFILYLLGTLTPAISWDGSTYHLTVPRIYLENRKICFIPRNLYSNMPLGIEMLYILALMFDDIVFAKLIHFSFGLLLVFGIYALGSRFFSKRQGLIAGFFFLLSPVVAFEMKIEYIDLGLSFFSFISVYTFLIWRTIKKTSLIILAGIFSGLTMSCKYTGVFIAFCLFIGFIIELLLKRIKPKEVSYSLGLFFGISFLIFLPWLIKNIAFTGNPFYPMLYKVFGGVELWEEFCQKSKEFLHSIGMGRRPMDYLKLPYNFVVYGDMGHFRFDGTIEPFWLILIPILFFLPLNGTILYLFGFSLIFFIFWALTSQQARFFIPTLPFLSIISGYVIDSLGKIFKNEFIFWLFLVLIFGFSLFILSPNIISTLKNDIPVLVGLEEKDRYLTRTHQPYAMFQYINKNLKNDAKILFIWENRGFYCKRKYIADSVFEVSWIMKLARETKDTLHLAEKLKEMGISHILINRGLQSIFMREEGMELIDKFIKERTNPVYSIHYLELYEVVY